MLPDSRLRGNDIKFINQTIITELNNIEYIKREADHCVKCGLCLPHCPTYVKTHDEGDSPRGRISLMQGLAHNRLELSARLEFHLDRCLTCRACEDVCPSNVHYGQLIDSTRALIQERRPSPATRQWLGSLLLDHLIINKSLMRFCARALRIYQKSGLRWLLRNTGLLRLMGLYRTETLLPDIPAQPLWQAFYPANGDEKGQVALFTGCIGSIFDRDAANASITLLNRCGYGVYVPNEQTCCGALHRHSGLADQARELARKNLAVFNSLHVNAVLYTSSGCGATLNEYSLYYDSRNTFNAPVMDICQFLNSIEWPTHITFKPLNRLVAVHDPCSLQHVLHQQQGPYTLLQKIPGITVMPLPDNSRCCGAAGSYMLSQPEMADSLRDDKIEPLKQSKPAYLVTSNIGCALHLISGIREQGLDIEVIHPLTLLIRSMA